MERESFEDESVAQLLNNHFVAIKVDREERPDIDSIYMTVCQALTGQGGWPLTIVMTPDREPFFAGTYFPKVRKYGRPGLLDILTTLSQQWDRNHDEVLKTSHRITNSIGTFQEYRGVTGNDGADNFESLVQLAMSRFEESFDKEYGGFGQEPKFPSAHNLCFLLRYYHTFHDQRALQWVRATLEAMARGGIYDHLGGGFSRYSVDRQWLVPHFEKMLYDNALLAIAYLEGYQVAKEDEFVTIARETLDYLLRDMRASEGGFFSAEDADSEGVEGKFYVWTVEEIEEVLGNDFGSLFCEYFNVTRSGNFEGKNVLNLIRRDMHSFCANRNVNEQEFRKRLMEAKEKLWEHRERRIHPHKDDKILTAWNGLVIVALAKAWKVLGEPRYRDAAIAAAEFVLTHLMRKDGRLLARYRDGEAAILAYVDDYAFLTWGFLELFEATFEARFLRTALDLTRDMQRLFWDCEQGGFFLYGNDAEQLIARPKEIYDGAMPSGNSVAILNLLRLARMTGDTKWEELASRSLQAFARDVQRYPAGHTFYLMAILFASHPEFEIILVGNPELDLGYRMMRVAQQAFLPNSVTIMKRSQEDADIVGVLPLLKDYAEVDGLPTAYVCEGFSCQAPINDVEEFRERLQRQES